MVYRLDKPFNTNGLKKTVTNVDIIIRWRDFHRLRLYARGEQSVAKYKNELAIDGDLSYLNLDWTPVPILPKFVDIVVNGMQDREFKVKLMLKMHYLNQREVSIKI